MSTTTGAMTSEEAVCEAASSSHIQVVSFLLGDEKYGINIVNVQEIIRIDRITQMPHVPDHVRGLSNLRGHVIPIIDLRMSFALPATATTESSRIIVLSILDKTIGIIVDAVDEVLRVNESQIEPA
ncbi:MAG: chemotaxis protein CheW, partial [Planctomycetota bacterium]